MKIRIITFMLIMLGVVNFAYSQAYTESLDEITIQSDTIVLECTYNDGYQGSKNYDGVVGYVFSVTDTITQVSFEGRYPESSYVQISKMDTVTVGTYSLFDENPIYQKYRIEYFGSSGDTSTVYNIIYFDKLPVKK